jgi:anti-sigma-K factor RskA
MYDDAQDALAAEYVLGTLSADEREHAEALMSLDSGFAASIKQWERRLGELNVMVEAIEPPPEVWDKIKAQLGASAPAEQSPAAPAGLAPSEMPVEAPAAVPVAPAEDLPLFAGEPGEDAIAVPPPPEPAADEELPPDVSDSITDSLEKSLAGPPTEAVDRPAVLPAAEPRLGRGANVVQLQRRVGRWRRMTVLMGAIAALLAVYIGVARFAPGLIPLGPRSAPVVAQAPATAPSARLVAALNQEPTAPAFLLTVDPQRRTMVVRRVSAMAEPGHSYELWLIAAQAAAPRSLGVIGADEFTERPIPGNFDVATLRAATYAVSLEPQGGSPSGAPTGPVLFTGKMVESVPTAPRT